jgi:hypothetical protein
MNFQFAKSWIVILVTVELALKFKCISSGRESFDSNGYNASSGITLQLVASEKNLSFTFMIPPRNITGINDRNGPLPSFAEDYSEYVLGAVIERVPDSFDLFATVFLLRHTLLDSKTSAYFPNGLRRTSEKIYCRVSHTKDSPYYDVEGKFVKSALSPEYEGDMHVEILRCKMEDTEKAYMSLAGSSEALGIELLRGRDSLLQFRIPWRTRKTGYMLSEQEQGKVHSRFNAWKGFDKQSPGLWAPDRMHLCVAGGWDVLPIRRTLSSLLEFLQHHILLEIDHIFTAAIFEWSSQHMSVLRNVLGSFIDDELVSLTSYADNDFSELKRFTNCSYD